MLYNNTSWKLMIMILENKKDSYALLNCLAWNQDLLMHDLCQNSDIVLYCENIEQIIEIILNSVATTEMTSHRVDSDLRTLFAIGKLDDYEKLKKECGETSVVLKGMEARIQERLKIFRNMSPREVSLFINRSHHVRVFFTFYIHCQWWRYCLKVNAG